MEEAAGPKVKRHREQFRRICFTLNNWVEGEYVWITEVLPSKCIWMVVGKEIGESGTNHLQGACIFRCPVQFQTIKRWIGLGRAHFERMRGSPKSNFEYCTKEDKEAFTYGQMPEQGKRNDIHAATELLQNGATMQELAEEHPTEVVKYHRGLSVYRNLIQKPRDISTPPSVYWLYGDTGTGKTRSAYESTRDVFKESIWFSNNSMDWFDGYEGQDVAIFDDFRSKGVKFDWLLRILDRYPLRVPVKGGFSNWFPKVIIITTPESIRNTFERRLEHKPEDIRQLERRVTASFCFPEDREQFSSIFMERGESSRSDVSSDGANLGGSMGCQ